jgi:DnaJ like chaperone protein
MTAAASAGGLTPFEAVLVGSDKQYGICLVLMLAWIGACDGKLDEDEESQVREIASKSLPADTIDLLLRTAREEDLDAIQLACEIVRSTVKAECANELFTLTVIVAVADEYLRPSEQFVLRLYGDLLGLNSDQMNAAFLEVVGKPLPPLPDPSSAAWWGERAKDNRSSPGQDSSPQTPRTPNEPDLRRLRALGLLGLDETATGADIKSAYRRLAHVHHPDRFSHLGGEAQQAANISFRRIKEAYEFLTSNA